MREELGDTLIVAVSKRRTPDEIMTLYDQGCRDFGESYLQEALPKIDALPRDIRWHLVGHLQRKKVPKVLGRFHLIHSVDTLALAAKLTGPVLLQVNISGEESKEGFVPDVLRQDFAALLNLPDLQIEGLMTMAPKEGAIRETFRNLRHFRDELQEAHDHPLPHLSMGMSRDYEIAVEEGATMVRLGSLIF